MVSAEARGVVGMQQSKCMGVKAAKVLWTAQKFAFWIDAGMRKGAKKCKQLGNELLRLC